MRRLTPLLAATTLLLAPAAAHADGGAAVIHDCLNHGRITGHYTQKQYAQALAELPADVAEYSDCGSLIRRAQLGAAGGASAGGGGGGAGGATLNPLATATPAERTAIARARSAGSHPLDLGGRIVRPGVVSVRTASVLNDLPVSLLIALGLLLAALAAVGGREALSFVRARR